VRHFHQPQDDSRPQARLVVQTRSAETRPLPARAELTPAKVAAGKVRRDRRMPVRSSERRELASMPRPGRLTSLDLQRRMRPAHRHEVARIAEETGIHIHTLYGWLRTLRLEGEINPEQPRDPEAWSATDKVSALLEVADLDPTERAAYCSRHGISEEQLAGWRQAALDANAKPLLILRAEEELQRLRVRDQREIRRMQKELRRRERSAAISDELLQVVRKLQTLWEQAESP
jgi:transposase-like protein